MARPPKYTPDKLKEKIDEYFQDRFNNDSKIQFVSIVDLCRYLENDRQTFYNYKNKSSYSTAIKKAEQTIISVWEKQLLLPGRNTTGAIFWLKNFAGMADRVEHQHQGKIEHKHTTDLETLPREYLEQLNEALEAFEQWQDAIDVTADREQIEGDS